MEILGSPVVPNFTYTRSTLLRVSNKPINNTPASANDSFALASQLDNHNLSHMHRYIIRWSNSIFFS